MKTLEEILSLEIIVDAPDHPVFYEQFDSILEYIQQGVIPRRIIRIWLSSLEVKIHFSSTRLAEEKAGKPLRFDFGLGELDTSILAIARNRHLTVAALDDYRFVRRVLLQFIQ